MKNEMRKLFIKLVILILFAGSSFLLMGNFVNAQNYRIHEQIPGQTGQTGIIDGRNYGEEGIDTLQDYLESAYKFGIAIVAILAVIMIGVGGFMYIVTSAGNAGKLANAKEIITSAILGLVMALLSWLILFVINPDLVGNTLKGVEIPSEISMPHNSCKGNISGRQMGFCNGDKICAGDNNCVYKKDFCKDNKDKCEMIEYALPTEACGVVIANSMELSGVCTADRVFNCENQSEIKNGKPCLSSVCCTSEN